MRHILDFYYFGVPLLLVYEINKTSREHIPIVCFNKAARAVLPFEKQSFEDFDALIAYLRDRLLDTQDINLLAVTKQEALDQISLSVPLTT